MYGEGDDNCLTSFTGKERKDSVEDHFLSRFISFVEAITFVRQKQPDLFLAAQIPF